MTPTNVLIDGIIRMLRPMAYIVVAFGALISILGVVLIRFGNAGTTTLSLFGQKVNTSSVGIAAIALGCIVAVAPLMKIIAIMGRAVDGILRTQNLLDDTDKVRSLCGQGPLDLRALNYVNKGLPLAAMRRPFGTEQASKPATAAGTTKEHDQGRIFRYVLRDVFSENEGTDDQ